MTSSGLTEQGAHAVAFAETSKKSMPMIRPNQVGTLDVDLTTIPLRPPSRLLHPGTPLRHMRGGDRGRVVDRVDRVLAGGRRAVLHGDALRERLVREMLHACESRRVGACLKLALDEHRVSDVHDEAHAHDQHDHRQCDDGEDLPALVACPAAQTPTGPRVPVFAIRGIHRRTITAPIGGFPSLEPVTGHELAVWADRPTRRSRCRVSLDAAFAHAHPRTVASRIGGIPSLEQGIGPELPHWAQTTPCAAAGSRPI